MSSALLKNGSDFVYIHVEAPDEMGHQGQLHHKVQSIEYIDEKIIAVVKAGLDAAGEDYRILVLPDHPTPIRCRTHTSDPVPYVMYDSTRQQKKCAHYTEKEAAATGNFEAQGYKLMDAFMKG